jgi:hypothetical protein
MRNCQGTPKWSCARNRAEEERRLRGPWEEGQRPEKTCQYIYTMASSSLCITYRENDWDTSSDGLATIEGRGVAHEQILPAVGLPAEYTGTEEQDLYRVACREGCVNTTLLNMNGRLRAARTGRDGTGLIRAVHGGGSVMSVLGSGRVVRMLLLLLQLVSDCRVVVGGRRELCERGVDLLRSVSGLMKWDVLMFCSSGSMTTRRSFQMPMFLQYMYRLEYICSYCYRRQFSAKLRAQ